MEALPGFIQCLPDDRLPKKIKNGQSLIVNWQGSNEGGTHWTAVRARNNTIENFDSLGFPPDDTLVALAKRSGMPIYSTLFNGTIIKPTQRRYQTQADESVICGYYAILYLYDMSTLPYPRATNRKQRLANDERVRNIFRELMRNSLNFSGKGSIPFPSSPKLGPEEFRITV